MFRLVENIYDLKIIQIIDTQFCISLKQIFHAIVQK